MRRIYTCKTACNDPTSQKCCARQCLRLERDCQTQNGSSQEGIEARGHLVILLSFFGLLQNDMHVGIVSTHYRPCEVLFLYLWTLYLT